MELSYSHIVVEVKGGSVAGQVRATAGVFMLWRANFLLLGVAPHLRPVQRDSCSIGPLGGMIKAGQQASAQVGDPSARSPLPRPLVPRQRVRSVANGYLPRGGDEAMARVVLLWRAKIASAIGPPPA